MVGRLERKICGWCRFAGEGDGGCGCLSKLQRAQVPKGDVLPPTPTPAQEFGTAFGSHWLLDPFLAKNAVAIVFTAFALLKLHGIGLTRRGRSRPLEVEVLFSSASLLLPFSLLDRSRLCVLLASVSAAMMIPQLPPLKGMPPQPARAPLESKASSMGWQGAAVLGMLVQLVLLFIFASKQQDHQLILTASIPVVLGPFILSLYLALRFPSRRRLLPIIVAYGFLLVTVLILSVAVSFTRVTVRDFPWDWNGLFFFLDLSIPVRLLPRLTAKREAMRRRKKRGRERNSRLHALKTHAPLAAQILYFLLPALMHSFCGRQRFQPMGRMLRLWILSDITAPLIHLISALDLITALRVYRSLNTSSALRFALGCTGIGLLAVLAEVLLLRWSMENRSSPRKRFNIRVCFHLGFSIRAFTSSC